MSCIDVRLGSRSTISPFNLGCVGGAPQWWAVEQCVPFGGLPVNAQVPGYCPRGESSESLLTIFGIR